MKVLMLALVLTGFQSFAATKLTLSQQKEVVEKLAKQERRELWVSGHVDVSSSVTHVTAKELEKLLKEDSDSEQPLNSDEVHQIRKCSKSTNMCSVFTIDVSGSYMSGYGHIRFWILLNPDSGHYSKISQSIYTE